MVGFMTLLGAVVHQITWLIAMVKYNVFPAPLSMVEERDCVVRMVGGDDRARQRLIEHNLRLVAHVVKKFAGGKQDLDDLISIGTIGLIKAVDSYTLDKGTKLATFAARCIENEILMHLRSSKKMKNDVSLQEPLGTDAEGNDLTRLDLVGTPSEAVVEEVHAQVEQARVLAQVALLDEREQVVIRGRFGLPPFLEEQTQRDLAQQLGISRSYVSRIEKRALLKLFREFQRHRPL